MLDFAIEVARANPIRSLPQMGAVIMKRRKVLGVGMNSHKSHPLMKRFSRSNLKICQHAEVNALINAMRNHSASDIKGSTIFVARVLKDGCVALAKPCMHCASALTANGIKAVWTEDKNS